MDFDARRLRQRVEQSSSGESERTSDEPKVFYKFEITKFFTFRDKSDEYSLVKFTFLLTNEFESFEQEQVFSYNAMYLGKRLQDFIQQFARFYELKDDLAFEDFVGVKGTCYIANNYRNSKEYRKIMIHSLEDSDDEPITQTVSI